LARARGVDKAAISRRVARLEAAGALTTRPGARGSKLVKQDEFNLAVEMTTDAVREANGRASKQSNSEPAKGNGRRNAAPIPVAAAAMADAPDDPILAREQARKTQIAAHLAQLDLNQRLGQLLPLDRAQEAARAAAERLRRAVEQMPSRAEEVASGLAQASPFAQALLAALRSDRQGARTYFRALAREQLASLAKMATAFDSADV
jgi:hypothetical protein